MRDEDYPYVIPADSWKLLKCVLPDDLARLVMNCAWPIWIVTRVLMTKTTALVRAHLPKKMTASVCFFVLCDNSQAVRKMSM